MCSFKAIGVVSLELSINFLHRLWKMSGISNILKILQFWDHLLDAGGRTENRSMDGQTFLT